MESEADWVSESMVGTTDVLMDGWMDESNGGSKSGSMETMNGWTAGSLVGSTAALIVGWTGGSIGGSMGG